MRPELSQYNHVSAGKVREIYEIDDDTLLMVVSDRISAYDHILDPQRAGAHRHEHVLL